jgi:asparagine synthase (glutamine-hydrolysing)
LDSSVLTMLIHGHGQPLRTFSIGFDEDTLDERGYQATMIDFLKAKHSSVVCSHDDIAENFQACVWHGESPILRTAPVPMMLLSRLVHEQGYKVVLTGEGADEVLGGYDIFKEAKIRAFWAKNPASAFRPLLLKRLYPYLDVSPGRAQAYLEAFFGAGLQDPNLPYFSHIPRWKTTAHCKQFFAPEFSTHLRDNAITTFNEMLPQSLQQWHPFNRAQYIEAKLLMAGYLLCSQGDRMLMANSVEGRFPFLDHRVIEFANRLPPKLKMKVLQEKYLLKKSVRGKVPDDIVDRYKQPYRAPDIPAFFKGVEHDYVQEMMAPECIRRYGYFDDKKVTLLMRKILAGRTIGYKDNMAFVGILSTQLWHRTFIEQFHVNFGL